MIEVRETRLMSLNNYMKFFSQYVMMFGYLGKIFDYGLKCNISPGNV